MVSTGWVYLTRKFLNRPGKDGLGSVLASLSDRYAELKIHDCSRQVSLDIEPYDPGDDDHSSFENSIEKLEILERAIKGLRTAMLKQARAKGYVKPMEAK